ncbi:MULTISPECIES: sugar porter family MFS transporter [unclassified Dietzia]|uniref:sugar porter family MFS transporter n=1 Tax=unclassified Dietzia TaxID=2617939 RepID=UPI0015FBDCA2|nr:MULTISPECIES: sugar porter family MFS transporter [unclassified Dietzia]MBB1040389.1 sugar porter family MFS transporter [Dietzia sp. Cai40]MBB1045615.1 sugar porter family MFS transporter [Dietzia sp. DQ11-44]
MSTRNVSARSSDEESFHTGRVVIISLVAALGGFLFGFDTAVINGAVDAVQETFGMNAGLTGFVVSSALLGCIAGAYLAGRLADRWGRTRVMVLASALFTVSAIGSGLAFGPWDLILWRVVGGLGVGAASVIAPAYIAEVAPPSIRGRLGSLQQLAIVSGIFVALLSDAWLAAVAGGAIEELWLGIQAWRWMFLTELVPAITYGVLALMIPESPRYLLAKGLVGEARDVLRTIQSSGVDNRIKEIRATVREDRKRSWQDMLNPSGRNLLPIVWIGIVLSVFQQAVGINVIFYYSTSLWQSVGFTEADALTQTVITSVTNIVVTIVAIALIDKIGRRRLLMTGSVGMTVSLAVMALMFSTATMGPGPDGELAPQLGDTQGLVALIAANGFVVFFGMSWGPAVWVLLGEMFNNRIRTAALGLAAAAQWLANFAVSTAFPPMAEFSLTFTYGFYAVSALLSLLFVAKFIPETTGRSLEDME